MLELDNWYESTEGKIWPHLIIKKPISRLPLITPKLITITAGRGSVLPYIKYKDFTGKELLYRKNTDLASYEDLKILSSWHTVTVYFSVMNYFEDQKGSSNC